MNYYVKQNKVTVPLITILTAHKVKYGTFSYRKFYPNLKVVKDIEDKNLINPIEKVTK
jgi:hypothetical protein